MDEKQDFKQQVRKQLDELSKQIDVMETKMVEISGEAKKVYNEQSADLKKLANEARGKLEEAMEGSEESWEQVKGHVDLTRRALKNSFNYFLSHYRKKEE